MSDAGELWRLAAAVARRQSMAELLPAFHEQALRIAGGHASVLLRFNPRTGRLQAESAAGVEHLDPDEWLADAAGQAAAEQTWTAGPRVVEGLADVQRRLGAQVALLTPLCTRDERLGLLLVAIADREAPPPPREAMAGLGDLLSLALERARLQRGAEVQQDLRELGANLTRAMSSALDLGAGLEIFCTHAARLFAADGVSVWLHDRRAHSLNLVASSDAADVAARPRIPTGDDAAGPLTSVMRRSRAEVMPAVGDRPPDVLAPLRGHRRALGTLECRGVRIEPGDAIDLLDRVEQAALSLSAAIENVWLLEEVIRSRRQLESTFNSLTDLVIVCDGRLRVTQANQAFASRVGRRVQELMEQPLTAFLDRDVVSWIAHVGFEGGAPGPGAESREVVEPMLHGTFIFTVSPLIGGDTERIGTVIVARDVTAQARLQAERAELRDRLAQSEKLAALGQFVAGIAHELNNPLQGVLGHVELMLHGPTPGIAPFKRDLKLVFREADRAAKIVHNLLVFAGSRRITRRRLNVNHVIGKVVALRATACAAAGITIDKELAPSLPRLLGDALLLQQAVLNIVMNAEHAMAGVSGARVLGIRTRALGRHGVEIRVTDTGRGIAADALPRLFEPFFTTKPVGEGTGLGLAIVYGIVQEHGGQLLAANRPEGGAAFIITLPGGSAEAVE